jgi:hypothetical protein
MDGPTYLFMCVSPTPGCPILAGAFGVQQELGTTISDDTEYELTVAVGNRDGTVGTYGAWGIQLLAGSTVRAEVFSDDIPPLPSGTFTDVSVDFVSSVADPDSGEPLGVRLLIDPSLAPGNYADFDNVRVTVDGSPVSVADHDLRSSRTASKGRASPR